MGNIPEGPKFPRPIRAAAIIETTAGILLVKDNKDKGKMDRVRRLSEEYNAAVSRGDMDKAARKMAGLNIASQGRFCLPGGGIELIDYKKACAEVLLGLPHRPKTDAQIEHFRNVVKEAIIRETKEEVGLIGEVELVPPVIQITGETRDHVICILRAEGTVCIAEPEPGKVREINGIGFLTPHMPIALNSDFFQTHVQQTYEKYARHPKRPELIPYYLSRLTVPKHYMDDWLQQQKWGHANLRPKIRRDRDMPIMPYSTPNFVILDENGEVFRPHIPRSFTESARSHYVPPHTPTEPPLIETRGKSAPPPPLVLPHDLLDQPIGKRRR